MAWACPALRSPGHYDAIASSAAQYTAIVHEFFNLVSRHTITGENGLDYCFCTLSAAAVQTCPVSSAAVLW